MRMMTMMSLSRTTSTASEFPLATSAAKVQGMQNSNFETDDQAWHTGFFLGELMKHGVEARPVLDDNGNYTPHVLVKMDMGESLGKPQFVQIEVVVLP